MWLVLMIVGGVAPSAMAQATLPGAKPVPDWQVIPLPQQAASLRYRDTEFTRYWFDPQARRPFLFPVQGPSGRSLTRMGHPHDPEGHSHHNSVWVSHNDVNGHVFWADRADGRIVHQRMLQYADAQDSASLVAENAWIVGDDQRLLREIRRITASDLPDGERMLIIDLRFEPVGEQSVTFGQTPFGLIGVRMAKTIGVHDGGGIIRNSEGNVGEQGDNGCFRKPARWCDYSGPIALDTNEGITLMDHPQNASFPSPFHVRDDGWMGACLTHERPITLQPGESLDLRYGLYVHRAVPTSEVIEGVWRKFTEMPRLELANESR